MEHRFNILFYKVQDFVVYRVCVNLLDRVICLAQYPLSQFMCFVKGYQLLQKKWVINYLGTTLLNMRSMHC